MGSRVASVVAALLLAAGCGSGDDGADTVADISLGGDGADRSVLTAGVVVIELQSASPRLTDTLTLDVSAAGDETNPSSLFAVCSGLERGGDGSRESRYRVGVTDLRRLDRDARLLSVEVTSAKAVDGPGEYRAELLVFDRDQRQEEMTGTMTIDGPELLRGTFAMTSDDNEQVRGTFRCGLTPSAVTTTTSSERRRSFAGMSVMVAVGDGARRRSGAMTADAAALKGIDVIDETAAAHCSAVHAPTTERYVARLDGDVASERRGGLVAFDLEIRDAMNASGNRATLRVSFDGKRTSAAGAVELDAQRASARFSGATANGTTVTATFECERG